MYSYHSGSCGLEGEGCTVIEITLENPTIPGTGSSTNISISPPSVEDACLSYVYSTILPLTQL